MPSTDNKYVLASFLKKMMSFVKKHKTIEYLFGVDDCDIKSDPNVPVTWLGDKFRPVTHYWDFGGLEDSLSQRMRDQDVLDRVKGIYWINEPRHREVNLAYTTV